jgi:hypothetical protein
VIILANVKALAKQKLSQLIGDFSAEIFDYARCYKELLFPLVSATYYTFGDLHIALNLSNKNAGRTLDRKLVIRSSPKMRMLKLRSFLSQRSKSPQRCTNIEIQF